MRLRSLLAAAVLLAGGLAGAAPARAATAGPADDQPTDIVAFAGSDCPQDSLCLFYDSDYTGGGVALRAGDDAAQLALYGFNDRMSSWSNGSGVDCVWTRDADGQGEAHVMRRGDHIDVTPEENDTASSIYCA